MKRIIAIIIDGVGIGELPDASIYGDAGSHTLGNLAKAVGGLSLPNLEMLGLGKISSVEGLRDDIEALGGFGKMAEKSPGKDSTTGHWELAGLILSTPFPTYPDGFPQEVIEAFTSITGRGILANKPASGTEIIKEYGEEHMKTGKLIVYTSADSVFQIAAHQDIISREELYKICEQARQILSGNHAVARVIARPFIGNTAQDFRRTVYRRDFSLEPFARTLHLNLKDAGWPTVGIGKINDLYASYGIQKNIPSKNNHEGMLATFNELKATSSGLIMVNLVDFDMLWGHRNDIYGFYEGLKDFDNWLPSFIRELADEDILLITADHGNDPTTPSTDHSREYVPILALGPRVRKNSNLGTRQSFADFEATVAEYFNVPAIGNGRSFLDKLM